MKFHLQPLSVVFTNNMKQIQNCCFIFIIEFYHAFGELLLETHLGPCQVLRWSFERKYFNG